MERNINNREFEHFIKKNADQYRMIPSDKVWKGINNALHTRRRWYTIGLSALLLMTAASVTLVMISTPDNNTTEQVADNSTKPRKAISEPITDPVVITDGETDINSLLTNVSFNAVEDPTATNRVVVAPSGVIEITNPINSIETNYIEILSQRISTEPAGIVRQEAPLPLVYLSAASQSDDRINVETAYDPSVAGLHLSDRSAPPVQNTIQMPLTIESVTNSYMPIRLPKKLSWQFSVAPTVSYRKLSANKSYNDGSTPFADPIVYPFTALTDVNKAVTHKPDLGLQLGAFAKYPLTNNIKIRAGLQFNINKYDIKAYKNYSGEQATIDLNGNSGALTAWTYYRNYNGYKTDWLKNYYFSVSAPIGAELKILGNSRRSLGVAGTVQPTYILRDKAYLLSTDYKNYAKVPSLVRRVNVNTSFETFVNFTSRNHTQWQIGPQVRYQVLSSFNNQYPVRENLFDFGMRVGVTLNQ